MKTKFFSIITSCLILSAASVQAAAIAQGTEELRVNSGLVLNTEAGTEFSLNIGYGVFTADYFETGVFGGFTDNDILTKLYAGVFAEYNFETGTELIPFTGLAFSLQHAELDLLFKDETSTALVLGLYGGVKYFLTETVAVSTRLLLETASDDVFVDEYEGTDTNFTLDLGLSFFF